MINVKIKKLHPDAIIPQYQSAGAACFDLHAVDTGESLYPSGSSTLLLPGSPKTYGSGLAFEIPKGYVMLIFSRSGHGFNNSTRLANCVGVIDSDYRGEVKVKLTRDSTPETILGVLKGSRIAQAMVIPVQQVAFTEVQQLSETERGTCGFGSTGA